MSSLVATTDRLPRLLPVYTASKVSNVLPSVLNVTWPPMAGVHRYQIELPPVFPAWFGSPDCLVALIFVPLVLPELPARASALLKLSFSGGPVTSFQFSTTDPLSPLRPSTAMR